MTLGDKLIVMDDGNIQQVGSPDKVYHEPKNRFVAGFIGSPTMNFIEVERDGRTIRPVHGAAEFAVDLDDEVAARYEGHDRFEIGVRPQYFKLHTAQTDNAIRGQVKVTEPMGDEQLIDVLVGEDEDPLELTVKAPSTIDVARNDEVWLTIQQELIHGFDLDSGERIAEGGDQRQRVAASRAEAE